MAIGRNIPQEQAMLSQLPDEMLEQGLGADPQQSPFTQFLGAIEMTKRVKQRKSAKQTLDGQNGQPGTVVGRMMAQGSQVGPPQQAPAFMTGGVVPPQFQPGYVSQGGAASSPAPGRDSMTTQHRTSPNNGGTVDQKQLAYHRSPQSLAAGGIAGQPTRQQLEGSSAAYPNHAAQVEAIGALRGGYANGGIVGGGQGIGQTLFDAKQQSQMSQEEIQALIAAQQPQQSFLSGGEVQATSPLTEEEQRRLDYLRSRGLPATEAPLDGPPLASTEFRPSPRAQAMGATSSFPPVAQPEAEAEAGYDWSRLAQPYNIATDLTGAIRDSEVVQNVGGVLASPFQILTSTGDPAPALPTADHASPGPDGAREYGAIPDSQMAEMYAGINNRGRKGLGSRLRQRPG